MKMPDNERVTPEEHKKQGISSSVSRAIKREAQGMDKPSAAQLYTGRKKRHVKKEPNEHSKANKEGVRVGTAIQKAIRDALTEIDENSNHPFYVDYIQNFLTTALTDPNSRASQMLASGLFNQDTIKALDSTLDKQMSKDIDFMLYRLRSTLYKQQQEVFDDPFDHIMTICGRRSGKTILNSRLLVKPLTVPNRKALYVNLTFDNAIKQLWDEVIKAANACDLGIKRAGKADGSLEFVNGSYIIFRGNNNKEAINKARGYSFDIAILDEVQNQVNIKYAIEYVLEPTLRDRRGTLILSGTPPRDNYSTVQKLWESGEYHTYNWNMTYNPFIIDQKTAIKEICDQKGLAETDPLIQREYFGRFVADTEAQIYKATSYETIPDNFKPVKAFIGVDTGFTDYNGIVTLLVGYENNRIKVYCKDEAKFNHSTIEDIARVVKQNIERVGSLEYQVIVDQASHQIAYELQQTYGIDNVYCCYKYDESASISQLQDLFRNNIIVIPKNGEIEVETKRVMWKRDDNDVLLNEIDESEFHADILDAVRYASRQIIFEYQDELKSFLVNESIPKAAKEA